MIAIINYDAGNLASVSNALERLGVPYTVTNKIEELEQSEAVIFPGVGHARPAMKSLRKHGLDTFLEETKKPVLGICLGMQLLYESSEEGDTGGLGLIPGTLKRFDPARGKVPHMGWNTLDELSPDPHPLLRGLTEKQYFYFVHSYYAPVNAYTLATCSYLGEFAAVAGRDNIVGVQFHPEKSSEAGSLLLQNFIEWVNRPIKDR